MGGLGEEGSVNDMPSLIQESQLYEQSTASAGIKTVG
jgi:hypothetical protein